MGLGLIIFTVIFFLLGLGMFWMVKGSGKRYVVCGKSLPFALVAIMLTAQSIDANATIGNSSLAYQGGFWAGFVIPLGLAACLLITGLFFAKPLNRMNLLTLPDFYSRRYGSVTEVLTSALMGLSFVILVAGNFAGAAWIVSVVFKTGYLQALLVVAALILLYTVAGGLFSSAATGTVQILPALIGFAGCLVWLIARHGTAFFLEAVPRGFFDLSGLTRFSHGALDNWAGFLALALGDIVALDFTERIFAARTPRTAQRSCFAAAGFTLVTGLSCSFLGLMSLKLMPNIADARMVLPTMALTFVPFVYGLFMLAGVIGAGASTANGGILGVSTVLGRNILQKNLLRLKAARRALPAAAGGAADPRPGPSLSDRKLLVVSRLMALPVVFLAVGLAWVKPEPGILLVLAFDVVFAGCFVPLAGGIFWKKANTPGALAAIIAGSALRIVLYVALPARLAGLGTLLPPIVSLAVFIPVSLATQNTMPSRHEAIERVPSDEEVLSGVC
jgi:SSS family solute:Na+ symporter